MRECSHIWNCNISDILLLRFFKRVKNNLMLTASLGEEHWDWQSTERWCQAHRQFLFKSILQQLWLCRFFLNSWLTRKNTHHRGCYCARVLRIFLPDLSASQKSLFVGQYHDFERSKRRIKKQKYSKVALFCCRCWQLGWPHLHFISLASSQLTETSWPWNQKSELMYINIET